MAPSNTFAARRWDQIGIGFWEVRGPRPEMAVWPASGFQPTPTGRIGSGPPEIEHADFGSLFRTIDTTDYI